MFRPRVLPCLLKRGTGLVKTTKFASPVYLGEIMNTVKIFNDKGADELIVLDIDATRERRPPNLAQIRELATECFMPVCYGGGVTRVGEVLDILSAGIEKVAVNTAAMSAPGLIEGAARRAGSQSIVVSIDVRRTFLGRQRVMTNAGRKDMGAAPVDYAKRAEEMGAGEILLTSIDRDGTMAGYDLDLVAAVSQAVAIPVIACGGAGSLRDLKEAVDAGASAAAAGSIFVFHGPHKAVLIQYPDDAELWDCFALERPAA